MNKSIIKKILICGASIVMMASLSSGMNNISAKGVHHHTRTSRVARRRSKHIHKTYRHHRHATHKLKHRSHNHQSHKISPYQLGVKFGKKLNAFDEHSETWDYKVLSKAGIKNLKNKEFAKGFDSQDPSDGDRTSYPVWESLEYAKYGHSSNYNKGINDSDNNEINESRDTNPLYIKGWIYEGAGNGAKSIYDTINANLNTSTAATYAHNWKYTHSPIKSNSLKAQLLGTSRLYNSVINGAKVTSYTVSGKNNDLPKLY